MKYDNGMIAIWRKFVNWEWYEDTNTKAVFLHLLLMANWKEGRTRGKRVKRGQRFTSIRHLSTEVGLSEKEIRTALRHLQETGEITTEGTSQGTLITIEKYNDYQIEPGESGKRKGKQPGEQSGKQKANEGQQMNKGNKENNIEPPTVPLFKELPKEVQDTFMDFMEMRKKIKKSMTDRAVTIAVNKLNNLSGGNPQKAVAILEQSILNNWQSLYELKETSKSDLPAFKEIN